MSFFKRIFGKSPAPGDRIVLEHPDQLRKGDIVKFGFLPQPDLSNQRFEIVAVNTYEFGVDKSYCLTLKGEKNNRLWLSVENEDGEQYLAIAKPLSRGEVKQLFKTNQFAEVFEPGSGLELIRDEIPSGFEQWTAPRYTECEDGSKGFYLEGDYREREVPTDRDKAEALDYYLLENDSGEFAIEVEVYEAGETEVCATVYHELTAIDEMWPGQITK